MKTLALSLMLCAAAVVAGCSEEPVDVTSAANGAPQSFRFHVDFGDTSPESPEAPVLVATEVDEPDDDDDVAGDPVTARQDAALAAGNGVLTPDMYEHLTSADLAAVLTARQGADVAIEQERTARARLEQTDVVIPVAIILMVLGIIAIPLFARHRRERLAHETARMFLDADKPVPDGLFTATVAAKRNPIRRGVVLITAGFGAAAALASIDGPALVGLVPAFVGVGELIAWWLERRMSRDLPFDDVTAR